MKDNNHRDECVCNDCVKNEGGDQSIMGYWKNRKRKTIGENPEVCLTCGKFLQNGHGEKYACQCCVE